MKHSKGLILIIILFSIFALYFISQCTSLNSVIKINEPSEVIKLEIVLINPNKSSVTIIDDFDSIGKILDILNDMRFIPSYSNNRSYGFKPFESYEIKIYTSNDFYHLVKIYSNKYIGINGDVFKIIHKSEISKIYDIISSNVN